APGAALDEDLGAIVEHRRDGRRARSQLRAAMAGPPPAAPAASRLRLGNDADDPAAATRRELHHPRALREDGVVPADSGAVARLEAGAALADDDLAARHGLSGEHLHAEAFGVRVPAVAARAEALLMRHRRSPPS